MADGGRLKYLSPSGPIGMLGLSNLAHEARDSLALGSGPAPNLEGPWPSPSSNKQMNPIFSKAFQPSLPSIPHRPYPCPSACSDHPSQASPCDPGEWDIW